MAFKTFRALLISSLSGVSLGPQDNRGKGENSVAGMCQPLNFKSSTPAWHFCPHKRHHRLSIRLSMTGNGCLVTGNSRSIQGPNTLDGTNLLVLSVFVSQFWSISGILKLEGIRHLPAMGLMMSPQCLHCQHILPSLPDPT
jgi:hypothetical protein